MNQYQNNIQKVYDALSEEHEFLDTPCVSALEKLNASGNKPYIGEDGKLYIYPAGYSKSIAKYLEANNLVKTACVEEGSVFCDTSANLI